MKPVKVIIATNEKYSHKYEYILKELYERKIELLCTWGKYCQEWESAIDLFLTVPARYDTKHHTVTSSHDGEELDDVKEMAEQWATESDNSSVEVIEI